MDLDTGCPVCLREDLHGTAMSCDGTLFDCPTCGKYIVVRMDSANLRSARVRHKWNIDKRLPALLKEQTIQHDKFVWLQDETESYATPPWENYVVHGIHELLAQWPRTVPERIDRTLCNLARLSPAAGHEINLDGTDTALAFAKDNGEAKFHYAALVKNGWLETTLETMNRWHVQVTPRGWARFEEITHGASARENPVFVAMWFGGEKEKSQMDDLFLKGISPAIAQAGYKATRVDFAEHNDWIMDKVLGDIRLAPFVVADFTGNRNGVYFEAGFARGLGIPVIHTCRRDNLKDAHFDTQQLNHILWKDPGDVRQRLYNRIRGTIGQGPYPPTAVS
jgi:hypothetical protein